MFEKSIFVPPGGFRTSMLFHELQELSGEAAAEWHASGNDLQKIGLMWVVIRYDVQLNRVLQPGEPLTMQTWALPVRHRMSQRNYLFYDAQNCCVLTGSGVWAVSDRVKRTMVNPSDYNVFFQTETDGPAIPKPASPVRIPVTDSFFYTVSDSVLDMNCHMNNTCYFDMVEKNAIQDSEFLSLRHARVAYVNEARLGEEMSVHYGNDGQIWFFSGEGARGNYFDMSLEYYQQSDKRV